MEEIDYHTEAEQLDDDTRTYLYDQATNIGGIRDQPVTEWIEGIVTEMREQHEREYDVSDAALRQAALEAASSALQTFADDGYYEHF